MTLSKNNNAPVIAIRADGSESVGMGHVMRTMAIAEALQAKGAHVVYICADDNARCVIESRSFDCAVLQTNPTNLIGELSALQAVLTDLRANFVFVDSFYASDAYFEEVQKFCPVGSFAFGREFTMGLSLLVSYLPNTDKEWLHGTFKKQNTKLLLGSSYVPLRSEFMLQTWREISTQPAQVLIMAGGSDLFGMCLRVIDAMQEDPFWGNTRKHIVVGPACKGLKEARALSALNSSVTVHVSVSNMAELISSCDLAITACGYSVFELAACGVPMVTFATSDDQVENGIMPGVMVYVGDARPDSAAVARAACAAAKELGCHAEEQNKMRDVFKDYGLDGRGSVRIAESIINLSKKGD